MALLVQAPGGAALFPATDHSRLAALQMALPLAHGPKANAGRTAPVHRWRRDGRNPGLLDPPRPGTPRLAPNSFVKTHPGRPAIHNRYRPDHMPPWSTSPP